MEGVRREVGDLDVRVRKDRTSPAEEWLVMKKKRKEMVYDQMLGRISLLN